MSLLLKKLGLKKIIDLVNLPDHINKRNKKRHSNVLGHQQSQSAKMLRL